MGTSAPDAVGGVTPDQAWLALSEDPKAMLIDVRTLAEWSFVGTPDVSALGRPQAFIEWLGFPAMTRNEGFLAALDAEVRETGAEALYFICRSGARSHDAAVEATAHFASAGRPVRCFNVLEGFEGPLDRDGHRGVVAGWKARGLAWRQN